MSSNSITIKDVVDEFDFLVLAGDSGLLNYITSDMIARPGLELAGFFDFYDPKRVVLIGSKEGTFFARLDKTEQEVRLENLFKFCPPAVIFSKNVVIPDIFIAMGNKYNVPVLRSSDLRTTPLSSKLYGFLQESLAERISVHGVLLDINGMGTLITGKSGIGKSEIALELVIRGHQLISDDRVEIFQKEVGTLIGQAPKVLERYMEIRGIGVVDVVRMFGAGAYRENKKIKLVVELEKWEEGKFYDRIGLDNLKTKFFDTDITKIVLPVSPGRNVATLIESAAMNEKLKFMGYNSAEAFTKSVENLIEEGRKKR